MKQPFYERAGNIYHWTVNGMGIVAMWKGFMGDATRWISIPFTIGCTAIVLITYFIILRYGKVKSATPPNRLVNLPGRFRKKMFWSTAGALCLLWFGTLYNKFSQPATLTTAFRTSAALPSSPVFDVNDQRFRILILPWEPECDDKLRSYNIGRVLQKQLEDLGRKYNIPLNIHYVKDTIDFRNFTYKTADSLMKYHHADHILYGSYSLKECESDHKDKICFNYRTNLKDWDCSELESHTEYKVGDFNGLDDIRQGTGQGEADFIIHYIAAIALIKQGKLANAIGMLRHIKDHEKNDELLFLMGTCYNMLNDHQNALICNEEVIKINPANMEARVHLSVSLFKTGRKEEAKRQLEEVLASCPDNIRALRNMGVILMHEKQKFTAQKYLYRVIAVTGKYTNKNLAIHGISYFDMGNYERAKYAFEASLRMAEDHRIRARLAATHLHLKDTASAMACYEKAILLKPNEANYHYELGALYSSKKEYGKSQRYFITALNLNPAHDNACTYLGVTYYLAGDKSKGEQYIDKAIKMNPANTFALEIGYNINKYENRRKAKIMAEAFLKQVPEDATMWDQLGHVYNHLDDYKKGLSCFKQTEKMLPENHVTFYNIAATYSLLRNKKDALKYLAKAAICNNVVSKFVDRDRSFLWLQGDKDFCAVLTN